MDRSRARMMYSGLALLLAALVGFVVVLYPEGENSALPEPLEDVFPRPGDVVVRQTAVEVDLPVGYDLDLYVDGHKVPELELGNTPSTGRWIWQPAPGGSIEEWGPGDHTVLITWDRVAGGRPDPGEFEWSFRVL